MFRHDEVRLDDSFRDRPGPVLSTLVRSIGQAGDQNRQLGRR